MSLLATAAILIVAIILLIVTFIFATDALWQLGISNLFKSVEEVFEGKNRGDTATDYLIYAMIISGFLLVVFILLIVVAIILLIVGGLTGVDEVAGVAGGAGIAAEGAVDVAGVEGATAAEGAAAEGGGSSFLSGFGNLLSGWVGTILMVILFVVVFASSAAGSLCFLAAAEIRKEPKYNGSTKLKDAYEDAVIAGVAGIAVVVFAIMGIVGYYSYKYYRKEQIRKAIEKKKKNIARGLQVLAAERQTGK